MPARTKSRASLKNAGKKNAAKKSTGKKKAAKKSAGRSPKKRAPAKKAAKKKKELRRGPDTEVTQEVLEFIRALDDYKKEKNRPFPTWSEVLEVVRRLGYRKP